MNAILSPAAEGRLPAGHIPGAGLAQALWVLAQERTWVSANSVPSLFAAQVHVDGPSSAYYDLLCRIASEARAFERSMGIYQRIRL